MIFSLFKNSFVIGTVQFGKIYGITNFNNLIISKSEGKKIFNYCLKKDLNHLDNAEDYNFDLSLLPSKTDFLIDTKISIKNSSMNFISNNLVKKYRDYNIDTLYIHDPEYILSEKKKIYEFLVNLKKKKRISKIGISVYDPKTLNKLINLFSFDVVQLPYNILNRSFESLFLKLKQRKIDIYVRSIFLQGLLLDKKSKLSQNQNIINFHKFCELNKIKPIEACIDFVNQNDMVDKIVLGIHSRGQLKEILDVKLSKKMNYPKRLISKDKKLIDPRRW